MSAIDNMDNPLLDRSPCIAFDRIAAEHIEPAVDHLLADAAERLETLLRQDADRGFDNTILTLDGLTEDLDRVVGVVGHLEAVSTTPEVRAAYNRILPKVSDFHSSLVLNPSLWTAVKTAAEDTDRDQLSPDQSRYLDQTVRAFRRAGADLDEPGRQRMQEINRELSELTSRFSQNVLDARAAWTMDIDRQEDLAGLPQSTVDIARSQAEADGAGGWRLTLQAPCLIAVLTYCDNRDLRETLYRANSTLAVDGELDNRKLIPRILSLRQEKAQLAGYDDFPDYVAAERMARNGDTILSFLRDLEERSRPWFKQEQQELAEFVAGLDDGPDELRPWDLAYYSEKLRRQRYDLDAEELRGYFALPAVLDGLFELVERLFGIVVQAFETDDQARPSTWDPDVQVFSITDVDGTRLGHFYADFFPRANKRGGAWMNSFVTGGPGPDGFRPHVGLICANATPASGGRPSLLTHEEVQTVFHEFGHLLHHMLSKVQIRSQAGTHVAWDFVELPSQIMENWCWNRDALDLFARHYETGEPIPDDLFGAMLAARNFRTAHAMMRQLGFANLDMALHSSFPEHETDVARWAREILQEYVPTPLPDNYAMVCGFGHLFSGTVGYASGYYSYKWAEVLDADAFSRFEQAGIFDRETGREFVDKILSRGDSRDPLDLFRDFMGRDPDPEALLRRSGMADAPAVRS